MDVLTVNAGSSSLRLVLFRHGSSGVERLCSVHREGAEADPRAALREVQAGASGAIGLVAHRVVHGGGRGGASIIDDAVEREIAAAAELAPLHNPPALRCLRAIRAALAPGTPHVAVFDTAFFHDLDAVAARYPLPPQPGSRHELRRYGFHGSAHRAMWRAWRDLNPELTNGGRIITLQLGAGCSAAAIREGRAIDTSMGFTPLEGLMMATRSGDIDPGLLIYLQRAQGLSADALEVLLTRNSGLAGVSGLGGDMRSLLASADPRAGLAIDMFCYRARKYVGAYLAALGGADAILFGGGIGEHSPEVRRRILHGLEALGVRTDMTRNTAAIGATARISTDDSPVAVQVVVVDEARELAESALEAWQ